MASPEDYKKLENVWLNKTHSVGSPDLDALIDIAKGVDYIDLKIKDGDYFSGYLIRTTTAPETFYRVIKTGNVPLVIESVLSAIDYSDVVDGEFTLSTRIYVDISNYNDWSYVGGTPTKIGKPLSTEFINKVPQFDMIVEPDVGPITGGPDFVTSLIQYFRDTSGNRDIISGVEDSFFSDGRKLIFPANSEILVETVTSGDVGNTADVRTYLNFIEPGDY